MPVSAKSNMNVKKVFYKENEKNNLDEFNKGNFPSERELHIYTWMDATLRELSKCDI